MNKKIKCQHCGSENVRVFCDIQVAFKQDENGAYKLVDNLDVENIHEDTVTCECQDCLHETKIDADKFCKLVSF